MKVSNNSYGDYSDYPLDNGSLDRVESSDRQRSGPIQRTMSIRFTSIICVIFFLCAAPWTVATAAEEAADDADDTDDADITVMNPVTPKSTA